MSIVDFWNQTSLPTTAGPQYVRPASVPPQKEPRFYNSAAEEAPAYAIMAVTGVHKLDSGSIILKIDKPSSTFYRRYIVNGPTAVAASNTGTYQPGPDVKVAYDSGTPANGEGWGPKANQWTVTKNYPATCLIDDIYDSTNKIAYARLGTIDIIIGKLAGSLSQGSTATVNVWGGVGGSEAVISSVTLSSRDWLMKTGAAAIASGKKVVVQWINGIAYVTEAECP